MKYCLINILSVKYLIVIRLYIYVGFNYMVFDFKVKMLKVIRFIFLLILNIIKLLFLKIECLFLSCINDFIWLILYYNVYVYICVV